MVYSKFLDLLTVQFVFTIKKYDFSLIDLKHDIFDLDGHYEPDLTLKNLTLHWLRQKD
jgi:hypothetical protein